MKSARIPWKSILYVLLVLIVLCAGGYYLLPGFIRLQDMHDTETELEKAVRDKEDQQAELEKNLYDLQYDPVASEKVARDEMGMSKDNEMIYKFDR
ncbi:MAG: septum formation initiator family protein [Candidatus Auribacterota bacterium]